MTGNDNGGEEKHQHEQSRDVLGEARLSSDVEQQLFLIVLVFLVLCCCGGGGGGSREGDAEQHPEQLGAKEPPRCHR